MRVTVPAGVRVPHLSAKRGYALAALVVAPAPKGGSAPTGDSVGLTGREEQVMRLIARGYSNKEAAAKLDISPKSVETYKARAIKKFGVKSHPALVRYAARRGWLDPDAPDWV